MRRRSSSLLDAHLTLRGESGSPPRNGSVKPRQPERWNASAEVVSMAKSGIDARRKAALEDGSASYLARRAEIIRASAQVFRDRGFEAATLRDVAQALNTDRATLYY